MTRNAPFPCFFVVALALALPACGGSDPSTDLLPDAVEDAAVDAPGDAAGEVPADNGTDTAPDASQDTPGTDVDDALDPDANADVPTDTSDQDPFDVEIKTTPGGLPYSLPFRYSRPDDGSPPTRAEIASFTRRITGFWKETDYFTRAAETSAGMDVSTGYPDYLIWWHDFVAEKKGDVVTFRASAADGGSHNNAEPTGLVLSSAMTGHLAAPGYEPMRYVTEQYIKSHTACMKGFVFDENDPVDWLLARNIATRAHAFTLPSGKKKVVEYDEWYFPYTGWNADRFRYTNNPTWGDIWVTNKRSKDDVPYLWRVAAWLPYVIELSPSAAVRDAAIEALSLLRKSARDIVDSGWIIRTKDENGNIYIPEDQDLASFVWYTGMIPDAECDARLSTALLAYGDTRDQDCGTGQGSMYDEIAGTRHYFNYHIILHFHLAAAHLALTTGHPEVAYPLVQGLGIRAERYLDPDTTEPGSTGDRWPRDMSTFLLRSAAVGLPLKSSEARLIHRFHHQTVDEYADFPNWNLWDPSVPNGFYSFRYDFHPAHRPEALRIEDATTLIEYCWSPFRNPDSVEFVDCEIVLDPARWGEEGPCPEGFEHIPAGTFDMGTPEGGAVFFQDESPVHSVRISRPFCMQARETTQANWQALMGNNPSQAQGCDECPVETVNSYDAMAYCNALGADEGLDECYDLSECTGTAGVDLDCDAVAFAGLDCEGYRLPTEAEWEYAARAGTQADTYRGDLDPDLLMCEQPNSLLDPIAWFCGNSDDGPKVVGQKAPNPWGLYDILGNVFEWCWDLYQADYYAASPDLDPTGPDPASLSGLPVRMIRGGSWQKWAWDARASGRADAHLGTASPDLGFRPVRTVAP